MTANHSQIPTARFAQWPSPAELCATFATRGLCLVGLRNAGQYIMRVYDTAQGRPIVVKQPRPGNACIAWAPRDTDTAAFMRLNRVHLCGALPAELGL